MNKTIFPKLVALTLSVLIVCFLAAFYVIAWTEPTLAPPQGNAAAPLNVSDTPQTKAGALTIAAGGGDSLILKNGGDIRLYNADNSGSALLYVDNNGEVITPGNLTVGSANIKGDGSISANLNSDKLDDYHAADLMAQGGGNGGGTPYFFLTKTRYNGNLGGLSGADAKCNAEVPGAKFLRMGFSNRIYAIGNVVAAFYTSEGGYFGMIETIYSLPLQNCDNWTSDSVDLYFFSSNTQLLTNGISIYVNPGATISCNNPGSLWCVVNLY